MEGELLVYETQNTTNLDNKMTEYIEHRQQLNRG
jgi:hypothetical protein